MITIEFIFGFAIGMLITSLVNSVAMDKVRALHRAETAALRERIRSTYNPEDRKIVTRSID